MIGAVGLVNNPLPSIVAEFKNGLNAGCVNPFSLSIFFQIIGISSGFVATTLKEIPNN